MGDPCLLALRQFVRLHNFATTTRARARQINALSRPRPVVTRTTTRARDAPEKPATAATLLQQYVQFRGQTARGLLAILLSTCACASSAFYNAQTT